jgi:nitrite reductase/ring-hydroxylating ferredoxin subunit
MKRHSCPLADVLVANAEGVHYAVSNICSHAREFLSNGMLIGRQVVCPAHYAVFDLADGRVIRHPEGATIAPIKTYRVRVENGRIAIELEA